MGWWKSIRDQVVLPMLRVNPVFGVGEKLFNAAKKKEKINPGTMIEDVGRAINNPLVTETGRTIRTIDDSIGNVLNAPLKRIADVNYEREREEARRIANMERAKMLRPGEQIVVENKNERVRQPTLNKRVVAQTPRKSRRQQLDL